jgi:hypothetical protein
MEILFRRQATGSGLYPQSVEIEIHRMRLMGHI